MAYRGVVYRKQMEVRGTSKESMPLEGAIAKLKTMGGVKVDRKYKGARKRGGADQTVELVCHLGIDAKQADQMLRGAISLPKGLGKSRKVVAFCDGAIAQEAKGAGAIEAGADELIEKVMGGWFDFDVAIAHPSLMGKVGKLGKVLGPQGKMPSPKAGTVTADVLTAVREFTAGRIEFRNDAGGNIHLPVGKMSFSNDDIKANVNAVLETLLRMKPATAKGQYIKRVCISGTRTPSVTVAVSG